MKERDSLPYPLSDGSSVMAVDSGQLQPFPALFLDVAVMIIVFVRFGEGRSCGFEGIVFGFGFGFCLAAAVIDLER